MCCISVQADTAWRTPDGIEFHTAQGFDKHKPTDGSTSLRLFDPENNVELLVSNSESLPKVTAEELKKVMPVLKEEFKWTVYGKGEQIRVDRHDSVLFELTSTGDPTFQTVYTYVGRGTKPYALILNYPSPRDPAKVKLMKSILATVRD